MPGTNVTGDNGSRVRIAAAVAKEALPTIARAVSSNPEAYLYLAESIRAWPAQPALAQRIGATGWTKVAWRNLAGGADSLRCR